MMGLFTKKDPCVFCGGKVKGLFPTKIEGKYVCSDCYGDVDLPSERKKDMTLQFFRDYMAFREENAALREKFQTTEKIDFGFFDTKFMFDTTNQLLCMDKDLSKTIFEGKNIRSFLIKEDSRVLFEGTAEGLRYFESTVPESAMALLPQITQFNVRMEMYRELERMRDNKDDNDNNRPQRPYINLPEPFRNFNVEIYFDHPYWSEFTADMSGPTFDTERPSVDEYLSTYRERAATMKQLAQALMAVAFPGAPEVNGSAPVTAPAAAAPAVDAVAEIQRYKQLLDQGIISEEEFTAKKRQLMGL